MGERYTVEVEPEVRAWLETLAQTDYAAVERAADILAEQPTTLGEPLSRHLGGQVRELRVNLRGTAMRITYWLAPGRRIVLLTVFRKTRMRETGEVERAQLAQKACEAGHAPAGDHDTYDRKAAR
ncbi:type II toxin-antitoxin system RelE/ParE family toxin [Kitasatospora sp. HPMI-4]|uniref:type II toxin-antitoxin system RelE/ParE family toxin n=1 Tax=Kitasatospora sp. HPMI-4 TaxID=3448443 RepID=UPI003F1B66B7